MMEHGRHGEQFPPYSTKINLQLKIEIQLQYSQGG